LDIKRNTLKALEVKIIYLLTMMIMSIILCSCIFENDPNNVSSNFKIKEKGKLKWTVTFNHNNLDVKGYVFPASSNIKNIADERKILQDERFKRALELQKSAPTEELRKSYFEEIEQIRLNKDPWYGVASWPNWPVVLASYVFETEQKTTKIIVICQHKDMTIDLVFTIKSNDQLIYPESLKIVQKLIEQFDNLNKLQWTELSIQRHPIDDSNKEYLPKEIREFVQNAVFPAQD